MKIEIYIACVGTMYESVEAASVPEQHNEEAIDDI